MGFIHGLKEKLFDAKKAIAFRYLNNDKNIEKMIGLFENEHLTENTIFKWVSYYDQHYTDYDKGIIGRVTSETLMLSPKEQAECIVKKGKITIVEEEPQVPVTDIVYEERMYTSFGHYKILSIMYILKDLGMLLVLMSYINIITNYLKKLLNITLKH